jgi:hypothetical protein
VPKIWELPPSKQKTSTMGPLGGDVEDLEASTINAKNIDGGPLGGDLVAPPSTQKTSMVGPLGDNAEDPRASNINAKNVDGGCHTLVLRR